VFSSIQGEGAYAGYPCLFIRLSGCTRNCDFCDTKYHEKGTTIQDEEIEDIIKKSKSEIVVWTGGEPLLQFESLKNVIAVTGGTHHLETNGDLLTDRSFRTTFDYVSCSPKDLKTAKKVFKMHKDVPYRSDIKVVTDGKDLNMDLIPYATSLMPLSTQDKKENIKIMQRVWKLCIEKHKIFCLRQHVIVWGLNERGV